MSHVLPVFLFAAISTATAIGILVVATLIGPKKNTPVKLMPYESGMDPIHSARQRFAISYYLLAIEFLVFDVEILVLYPWAVAAHKRGAFDYDIRVMYPWVTEAWKSSGHEVFWAVTAFLAILVAGFVYTWRKGLFKWV